MSAPGELPHTQGMGTAVSITLLVALLSAAALAGLLYPAIVDPNTELSQSFVTNDAVNLFLGVPLLLAMPFLAQRGGLLGLLFWPGALLFVTYNSIAYVVALPLSWLSALYLLLILLSGYAIINLVRRVDGTAVQHLQGRVAERLVGGVLVGLGALFFLRAVSLLGDALTGGSSLSAVELGVLVADLVISLLWVLGGAVLWRKRPLGYAAGGGLLFQANMLFVALLAFLCCDPFWRTYPFR